MKKHFCEDCKWCRPGKYEGHEMELAKCGAPQNPLRAEPGAALVGRKPRQPEPRITYCSVHRVEGRFFAWSLGICGRRGRWFEPREPQETAP